MPHAGHWTIFSSTTNKPPQKGHSLSFPSFSRISAVTVLGEKSGSNVMSSGEEAVIGVSILPNEDVAGVTVGIMIREKYGQDIFGTNTYHHAIPVDLHGHEAVACTFRLRMDIGPGKYTVTAALHSRDTHLDDCFHWEDNAASFEVAGNHGRYSIGLCKLYPEIDVNVHE